MGERERERHIESKSTQKVQTPAATVHNLHKRLSRARRLAGRQLFSLIFIFGLGNEKVVFLNAMLAIFSPLGSDLEVM